LQEAFDVLILNDGPMDFALDLIQDIITNQ